MEKDKVLVLETITFEDLKTLIEFMYQGQVSVPEDRLRDFVTTAEFLQIKGLPSGLVHSLQRDATEMSEMCGKEGLASHLSHKRMRRSLVGGETSELLCEKLKTSSIGRKKSGDKRSLICFQRDLSGENVPPQPHSVLVNGSNRKTAVVPADKEPSVETKEVMDVADTPIWERDDENSNRVTDLFSSATAREENQKEFTSVPGNVSRSYGSATSPFILEIKAESSLPSFSSVTTSIPSSANTASTSPFVSSFPTAQRGGAMENSSSREQREVVEQRVGVKVEPVEKTEVIPAVFPVHSECTVEPMHGVWVEEMRSWEGEDVIIGTDTALFCTQEMANEDQDVAASGHYHPAARPNLTFAASTSSCVVAGGERKEVIAQDVKPEVNEHCMGQEGKRIENNDSIVDKMVESAQHGVVDMDEKVEKEDLVMVETIEGTEMDSAVEQTKAEEEEDLAPLSKRVSKMLGKESHKSSRRPNVFNTVGDVQVHVRKQQREKRSIECEECNANFVSKSKLMTHMRTHTGERPFQCSVCKVSFSQRSSLTVHKRTHTGERPFKCDVCERSFNQSSVLNAHKRTHTGERPFKCDVCGWSFCQNNNLTAHKRIHTRERPFQCNICKRSFTEKGSLTRHLRTHPDECS